MANNAPVAPRCLLCLTGSVAAVKAPELYRALTAAGFDVKVAATDAALHFLRTLPGAGDGSAASVAAVVGTAMLTDADEWAAWRGRGDPVRHIELKDWADVAVLAPLDANSLAKLANGLCDNLVTCVLRAWAAPKAVVVAPAMNTAMWEHPLTARHVDALRAFPWPVRVVAPVAKVLMCGVAGVGAMAAVDDIVTAAKVAVALPPPLSPAALSAPASPKRRRVRAPAAAKPVTNRNGAGKAAAKSQQAAAAAAAAAKPMRPAPAKRNQLKQAPKGRR